VSPSAITLLTDLPHDAPEGAIGLLFECAPDSVIRRKYSDAIGLAELIGDFESIKQRAFDLARKLLDDEPPLRGVKQLGIFEELVIRELQYILHAKALHDRLVADGFSICSFNGHSRLAETLQWFVCRLGSEIAVDVPIASTSTSIASMRRSWQRMRQAKFSRKVFSDEWRQLMDRIDPFHRRSCLVRTVRTKGRPRHAIWFYSTAYTFTRIGLLYEPHFPASFEFLVENPNTGGQPLQSAGRTFTSLYEFVSLGAAPSRREIAEARKRILYHLRTVDLSPDDAVARDAYLESGGFATFMERLLPRGLFHTCLFERFVESAEPSALVVGNPVFEGYALHAARKAGIPTLLLQHGILGDYCQFVDPPVDHYIVRGGFWREFLSPKARERSLVLNPVEPSIDIGSTQTSRNTVLFLTAPYSVQEFWGEIDLSDILLSLLSACQETRADLVIRVHPLESKDSYESLIQRLTSQEQIGVSVSYSQGDGLDDLLRRSAVAVTFSSTVFLDCLRHKVPVISFGWHDFSYKRQIAKNGVFHFCESLSELHQMVCNGVRGALPAFISSTEPFLASTPDDVIREQIRHVLDWHSAI